ncbi:hypothetical protein SLS62_004376 [Diatrype stigma]|uniref:Uncharacterized protein n=1 Tax=Diatrype stigma TaxID=117547 RepID=A0AAN9UUL8_9PEZI
MFLKILNHKGHQPRRRRPANRYFLATAFGDIDRASWRCGEVGKIKGQRVAGAAAFAVARGTYVYFHIDTATGPQAKAKTGMKGRHTLKRIWARYYGDLGTTSYVTGSFSTTMSGRLWKAPLEPTSWAGR